MLGADLLGLGWIVLLWLLGLSAAMIMLRADVARLKGAQQAMDQTLQQIRSDLAGLRMDLGGVARAQQIDALRRELVADLRPIIEEAVERKRTQRGKTNNVGAVVTQRDAYLDSEHNVSG